MSKYMVLLYANEAAMPKPGSAEFDAQNAAYEAVYRDFSSRGAFVAGDPLSPSGSATSVRVRDGKTSAAAGPAVTAVEQLIGYYVLECGSDQEASQLASTIPCATVGTVEVRPVIQM
jgi:hypothetical protein